MSRRRSPRGKGFRNAPKSRVTRQQLRENREVRASRHRKLVEEQQHREELLRNLKAMTLDGIIELMKRSRDAWEKDVLLAEAVTQSRNLYSGMSLADLTANVERAEFPWQRRCALDEIETRENAIRREAELQRQRAMAERLSDLERRSIQELEGIHRSLSEGPEKLAVSRLMIVKQHEQSELKRRNEQLVELRSWSTPRIRHFAFAGEDEAERKLAKTVLAERCEAFAPPDTRDFSQHYDGLPDDSLRPRWV